MGEEHHYASDTNEDHSNCGRGCSIREGATHQKQKPKSELDAPHERVNLIRTKKR